MTCDYCGAPGQYGARCDYCTTRQPVVEIDVDLTELNRVPAMTMQDVLNAYYPLDAVYLRADSWFAHDRSELTGDEDGEDV